MLPPLPRCSRWAYSSLKLAHPYQPSPKPLSGRPAHRPFRGLLGVYSRCGLHTRAVTKTVTVIRRLQTFRLLHACSGCFRLERSPGGACTRWKSAALSRRTWRAVNFNQARAAIPAGARHCSGRSASWRACISRRRSYVADRALQCRVFQAPAQDVEEIKIAVRYAPARADAEIRKLAREAASHARWRRDVVS